MENTWIRVLKVVFTGKGKSVTYGNNWPSPDLEISVNINKFCATMKDSATITITNLPYTDVVYLVNNKTLSVKVICGYRNGEEFTVFDGAVARINNQFEHNRDNKMVIFCTSKYIAQYCQNMLNFNLTSGMNTYAAIKYVCAKAGIRSSDISISNQLKLQLLQEVHTNSKSTASNIITAMTQNKSSLITSIDNQAGVVFSIFDANKSNSRVIKIKNSQIIGGYPRLNSSGLNLSVYPTFNFKPGDTILVNNSLINLEKVESLNDLSKQPGVYLDTSGKIDETTGDSYGAYMIMELEYVLNNRDDDFLCNISAKSRSLISNYSGGNS